MQIRNFCASVIFAQAKKQLNYYQKKFLCSTPKIDILNLFLRFFNISTAKSRAPGPKINYIFAINGGLRKNLAAWGPELMIGISADIGCQGPTKQIHQKKLKMQVHASATIHKEG